MDSFKQNVKTTLEENLPLILSLILHRYRCIGSAEIFYREPFFHIENKMIVIED